MLNQNMKIYIMLLFLGNIALFADTDLQRSVYDAAEDMMKFDEKMNLLIAKHNGVEYTKENSNNIMDFEERENAYVLERTIEDNNNTQIELNLKERLLSIDVTVREQKEIKTETGVGYETTLTQSTTPLYLPKNADETTMQDSYKDGILKITFQKLH